MPAALAGADSPPAAVELTLRSNTAAEALGGRRTPGTTSAACVARVGDAPDRLALAPPGSVRPRAGPARERPAEEL